MRNREEIESQIAALQDQLDEVDEAETYEPPPAQDAADPVEAWKQYTNSAEHRNAVANASSVEEIAAISEAARSRFVPTPQAADPAQEEQRLIAATQDPRYIEAIKKESGGTVEGINAVRERFNLPPVGQL